MPSWKRMRSTDSWARRLDALVIASSSTNPSVFERIQRQGLPLVLIDRNFPELDANYVGADDEAIGLLATEHLIEIGCKRIAHLRGPDNSPGVGRLKGYQNALAKHKFEVSFKLCVQAPVGGRAKQGKRG